MENAPLAVPILDLKTQYAQIKTEVDAAMQRVLASQHFINGPEVAGLEDDVARYCRAGHCIGVSSGSDALLVALMALDVGPGDEVITTPYTFFATAGAVARLGARPVFVDIDPPTYNIDAAAIEAKVTPRTRAIMPVHLFGQCAEMEPILAVARRHGLAVIEDAAQAIGAEYKGRSAGTMGTVGCFSFFPSKNLGAFGDGGAVVTNDAALADKIRCLRNHGANPKYYHKVLGGNFRLDTLQAAVLQVKLRHLDGWTARRQQNAAFYDAAFARVGLRGRLVSTPAVTQSRHIFNQYVVRLADRDAVRDCLKQQQITTEVYYPVPLHLQECFAGLGHRAGQFPESEKAALNTLALPVYPEVTAAQKQRVVEAIASCYQKMGRLAPGRAA
ncbi:MAG TPA: DegT/DnrJ/EryC1/StrS family aminotransferase [Gemmataceae bacterium]|jgi:dTDP-4-amino-4,6-dideoxygalactose transaminase|nr:DegT/DnrJ/EryC1/StrS family aminotransferase [Gemmataceae bacterium]